MCYDKYQIQPFLTLLPETKKMLPGLKILVVDDEETMRTLTVFTVLSLALAQPTTASSAKQGLCYLQKVGGFDLVITDYDMPGMTGLQFLQATKADRALRHIRLIIATGDSSQERIDQCEAAGASGYLVKPFRKEDLQNKIEQILRRQSD